MWPDGWVALWCNADIAVRKNFNLILSVLIRNITWYYWGNETLLLVCCPILNLQIWDTKYYDGGGSSVMLHRKLLSDRSDIRRKVLGVLHIILLQSSHHSSYSVYNVDFWSHIYAAVTVSHLQLSDGEKEGAPCLAVAWQLSQSSVRVISQIMNMTWWVSDCNITTLPVRLPRQTWVWYWALQCWQTARTLHNIGRWELSQCPDLQPSHSLDTPQADRQT